MEENRANSRTQTYLWTTVIVAVVGVAAILSTSADSEKRAEYVPSTDGSSHPIGNIMPNQGGKTKDTALPGEARKNLPAPESEENSRTVSVKCLSTSTNAPILGVGLWLMGEETPTVSDRTGTIVLQRKDLKRRPILYLAGWSPRGIPPNVEENEAIYFSSATASLVVDFEGAQHDWRVVNSQLYFPRLPQMRQAPWASRLEGTPAGRLLATSLPEGVCTVSVTLSAPGREHWTLAQSVSLVAGERSFLTLASNEDTFEEE